MQTSSTRILGLVLGVLFFAATPVRGQAQVQPRWDSKQMALNLVWTRVADIYGEAGSVESAEFSPDSRYIISGSKFDNQVIMWRTSDGVEMWRQTVEQEIERVAWSADGQFVASASEDYQMRVFQASDGALVQTIAHDNGIDGLAWSHTGRWLASGEEWTADADGTRHGYLRLFAMPEGRLDKQADLGGTINSVDFSSDDQYVLAAGHDGRMKVWRVADMQEMRTFQGDPEYHFISARFSPDDRLIAVGDNAGDVYVWDFETGDLIDTFDRSGHKVEVVEWTPDGQYLVTAGNDPFIRFFRTQDILADHRIYTALQVHAGDQAEYLHINQTGGLMVSAHQDGLIRLWVIMSEDPSVNARRHEWVKEQQRKAAEERATRQN